jgi:hypothetical protein
MTILYTRPTQMLSPAMQQAVSWHKEQSTRVRAYQPQRPAVPGNWVPPGGCENCVPSPPAKALTNPQIPKELFAVQQSTLITPAAAVTAIALGTVGITLFVRLLK